MAGLSLEKRALGEKLGKRFGARGNPGSDSIPFE